MTAKVTLISPWNSRSAEIMKITGTRYPLTAEASQYYFPAFPKTIDVSVWEEKGSESDTHAVTYTKAKLDVSYQCWARAAANLEESFTQTCTPIIQMRRLPSFGFYWATDGSPVLDEESPAMLAMGTGTYSDFLYGTSCAFVEQYGNASLSDGSLASGDVSEYTDYFEMKPYYNRSSIQHDSAESSSESGVSNAQSSTTAEEFIGISPQWWLLTTDIEKAQLNYDFAYCPDLKWAESLVPGERCECEERVAFFPVFAVDDYGRSAYEYVRDEHGDLVFDNNNEPILVIGKDGKPVRLKIFKAFRYYEITPPATYRTAIDGQPSVETPLLIPKSILIFL
jgi:hypothetical protein